MNKKKSVLTDYAGCVAKWDLYNFNHEKIAKYYGFISTFHKKAISMHINLR